MVITHCTLKEFKKRHPEVTAFYQIAWEDTRFGDKSGSALYGDCDYMTVMDFVYQDDDMSFGTVYLTDRV